MNKQTIDFKEYYYKYKALKYYLKNNKIEGGAVEEAAVQGTIRTNVFTLLGIHDNVILEIYESLRTRINHLPDPNTANINTKAHHILHDIIRYVRNSEHPDRVRRSALVRRLANQFPIIDILNRILNENDNREQFLNIFNDYNQHYNQHLVPAAE